MKKLLIMGLLTVSLSSNVAFQAGGYLIQYGEQVGKVVVGLVTVFVGGQALTDIGQKYNIVNSVPLVTHPNAERMVMERTNVDIKTVRECINLVRYGVEYQKFNKWTGAENRAIHACTHNMKQPYSYCLASRTNYNKVSAMASFQNTWELGSGRFSINRDGRTEVVDRRGLMITSYPSGRKFRLRGGAAVSKYREAFGWLVKRN